MYNFEVRFCDGNWCLTGCGIWGKAHFEPTKDRIEAYVDGFMNLRAGRVRFYRQDGSMERETVYEPHDLQLWAATGSGAA
jgi:hypothetical protein